MTRGRKRARKKKATQDMESLEEKRKRSWLETTIKNLDEWDAQERESMLELPQEMPPPIPTDSDVHPAQAGEETDPSLIVEPTGPEREDYTPKIDDFEDLQRELFDELPETLESITSEHEAAGRRIVAGYQIEPKCAEGTLSTVHRAVEIATGRVVAIKVPKEDIFHELEGSPDGADNITQQLRKIFEREIKAMRALKHPHIVEGHEWFMLDKPYLVMEFIETPMIDVFERDTSLARIAWFMKYAAKGVSHIHSKNMVHLDIRPKQYMVTKNGILKLVDLGSVRNQGECWKKDLATPMSIGYVPQPIPERNGKKFYDWSYDIYALGKTIATFALASTGMDGKEISNLITKESDRRCMKVLCERVMPAYNHGTGRYLVNDIIARCLTPRHPDGNYTAADLKQSAAEFEKIVFQYWADEEARKRTVQETERYIITPSEMPGQQDVQGTPETKKTGITGLLHKIINLGSGSKAAKKAGAD
ncbi:serine/threonine protein kinase [Nanoarchaeota archaeon]